MKHDRVAKAGSLESIAHELDRIERHVREAETSLEAEIDRVPPEARESARNLVHYVALRQLDLRELQEDLQRHGLSSLGRSEGSVLGSLLDVETRVTEALVAHGKRTLDDLELVATRRAKELDWPVIKDLLHQRTRELFGHKPEGRHIYVMVTAPSADEADLGWMRRMLKAGMNVLRVNTAHDDERGWSRILEALERARREEGRECRVLMDLAGPKIRTGPVGGARRILTFKPTRSELGKVISPARISVRPQGANANEAAPHLVVEPESLALLRKGDVLRFRDARDKKRKLVVVEASADAVVAVCEKHAYVVDEARARIERDGKKAGTVALRVEGASDTWIEVREGDEIELDRRDVEGRMARRAADGRVERAARIGCTLPAALEGVRKGHRVLFDDGRIATVVERVEGEKLYLKVVRTQRPTVKLRAEKGINLPDSEVSVPSLTKEDRAALVFAVEHADAVGLSFVRSPDDVRALVDAMASLRAPSTLGIVLKIETALGFHNLPRLLLAGLARPPLGIMIARGDLAVEVGYERLAELQEETLWFCEASHVPAIWATQVLDTLARTGIPSRAEVTDAAMSVAAECVMLNKGPFVDEAVTTLANILTRMEKHHYKKRSLFRRLGVSELPPAS